MKLSKRLAELLGFDHEKVYTYRYYDVKQLVRYSKHPINLQYMFETMYIYCSIVENQIIGNTVAPLLRIIDLQDKFKSIINRVYDTPHYVPVLLKDISAIEINIKTDMNEFVPFEFGKVVIKLHFRRRSYF